MSSGVAVFGLAPATYIETPIEYRGAASDQIHDFESRRQVNNLCELTGGEVLTADTKNLAQQLTWFVTMLRGRYIIEFPRPHGGVPGATYKMVVTIEKSNAFIRPAGITVMAEDQKILHDPTTVPNDPSNAPQIGKKKPPAPE